MRSVNDARRKSFAQRLAAERTLVEEILATSERIRVAYGHARRGSTHGKLRLLRVVATSNRYLAIAEAARVMRLSRQAAHEIVVRAVGDGLIELLPNRDDRRVLQLEITSRGRSALAAFDVAQRSWLGDLLLGLSDRDLATANDVLRGLRERLVRAEQRDAARRR